MFYRYIFLFCVFVSSTLQSFTVKTISAGNWEDPMIWSNHQIPTNPDSIIIYHYVVLNQNCTINSPTVLYIDTLGTICGDFLLETLCGASFINYGHLFLGQIKTRSGLNYLVIQCKNYMIITGCSPSASGFSSLPPNGSVAVWPPVLCKTQDTNWESGTQIGLLELENNQLNIYPNPITNELLNVVTLSNSKMKIHDVLGNEFLSKKFENKTEVDFSSLPAGVYFIELEMNGKNSVKKIIKSD